MKEGWTYKKLGEVTFYPKDRISLSEITADRYVGVENLVKDKGGVEFPIYLPNSESAIEFIINDILIGNIRPYLKKIWVADRHGGASGDVIIVRISTGYKSSLRSDYLFKVLSSDKFFEYDNAYTHGAKMPRGDKKAISEYLIPIPPLPTQQSIVSELDKINELIALKKFQLKDLDFLAQSIFYEMFGDPVINEKGWEVKKWNQLFDTKLGKMLDKAKQNSEARIYPYLANFNIQWGSFDLSDLRQMPFTDNEIEKYKLKKGDLMICEGGESGRCAIWPGSDSIILFQKAVHRARIKDNSAVDIMYIKFFMEYAKKGGGLKDYISKSTIEHLTGEKLNMVPIPLPPLSLQHQFAERVEAIERMKQQVQTAIKDLETLLASRMQYWFD